MNPAASQDATTPARRAVTIEFDGRPVQAEDLGLRLAFTRKPARLAEVGEAGNPGDGPAEPAPRRSRDNSKQAQVIAMLKRPEGATIAQICEVTGWQQHTVRGTFAGAFKKKLGLALASEKAQGGPRIYRIAA